MEPLWKRHQQFLEPLILMHATGEKSRTMGCLWRMVVKSKTFREIVRSAYYGYVCKNEMPDIKTLPEAERNRIRGAAEKLLPAEVNTLGRCIYLLEFITGQTIPNEVGT
jgi:hypothetical protein